MTVLMSLRSRLMLARLAVTLPLTEVGERLVGLVAGGVHLILGTSDGDVEGTEARWRGLAGRIPGTVLLAHDQPEAMGDVTVVSGPWQGGVRRAHRYALAGRRIGDLRSLGDAADHDFLVLRDAGPGSRLLAEARSAHPPLVMGSLPWFAEGDLDADAVARLTEQGVRRVMLTGDLTAERLSAVGEVLQDAWRRDPLTPAFRGQASLA